MDQNLKNRLVGIIVIFALAVVFLPMILDGSGVRKDKLEVIIPPQPLISANPEFDTRVIELNSSVGELTDLEPRFVDEDSPESKIERPKAPESDSKTVAEQPVATTKPRPESKTSVASTGGESWVLQVGSFKDRGKALAQRDKLRKSNIAAVFIEQFNTDSKASYRVRLGPFVDRDKTRVAQNKVKAKHDIDGIIMKYER